MLPRKIELRQGTVYGPEPCQLSACPSAGRGDAFALANAALTQLR